LIKYFDLEMFMSTYRHCELRWKDFLITLSIIPVICYVHNKCSAQQVERLVPVYHKTDVLSLQTFLRDKFARWQEIVVAWRRYVNNSRK